MVVHALIPIHGRQMQADAFQASLVYIVNSRTASVTNRDSFSKEKKGRKEKKRKKKRKEGKKEEKKEKQGQIRWLSQ